MKLRLRTICLVMVIVGAAMMAGCGIFSTAAIGPGDALEHQVGDVLLSMRYGPAATFPMGVEDDAKATVTHDFWIGETPVTYELWYEVRVWAEENGYRFHNRGREGSAGETRQEPSEDRDHPVTTIRWNEAIAWCNALSEYMGFTPVYMLDGEVYRNGGDRSPAEDITARKVMGFRLPTAEEWELAARYRGRDRSDGAIRCPERSRTYWTPGTYASGATGPYTDEEATMVAAWYDENTGGETQPVGTKPEGGNHLHLYDMSGNVFEWVDAPDGGEPLVYGGAASSDASDLQVGLPNPRGSPGISGAFRNIGIRIVLSLDVDPREEAYASIPEDADEDEDVVPGEEEPDEDENIPFPVGSLVEVEVGGQWFDAQVLEAATSECYITYDGYSSDSDEWVDISRVRDRSDLVIQSVEPVTVAVDHGTDLADVSFPEDIDVRLGDGSTFRADVQWGSAPYDGNEEGEYSFPGELVDLPPNVTNPDDIRAVMAVRVRDIDGSTSRIRVGGDTDIDGLLWYVEHDHGQHGYYFGTSSRIDVSHAVITDHRGRFLAMIVFDVGLLPIQWVFDDLTISVVGPRDSAFDAREALHVFTLEEERVDVTLDIEMDMTVEEVLDRIPEVFGAELSGSVETLRGVLEELTDALPWTVAKMGSVAESRQEVTIASTLAVACVSIKILDQIEAMADDTSTGDAGAMWAGLAQSDDQERMMASRELRQEVGRQVSRLTKHKMMGPLRQMLEYIERIASGYYDGRDIVGPSVSMLLCKGQSPMPNQCDNFVVPNTGGNVARCVNLCYVTLGCFTDICHPMMFSVSDALSMRVR